MGIEYEYTLVATDPDGDDICYFVDWGDNTTSGWTEYVASGVTLKHTWSEKGTYTITAKAKDVFDAEGPEGTLEVTMPRNRVLYNSLFLRFLERLEGLLERFPNALSILRQLLGAVNQR